MGAVSNQTWSFWARTVTCVAVFGSVVALAGVTTHVAWAVLGREEVRESDESIRRAFANRDLFTTVEKRIADHEAMIARLQSPVSRREEQRNLAVLYEELGSRSLGFNQMPRAEEAYQKSVALDPQNPKYMGDLANLYATAAMKQAETKQRVSLLRNSSDLWQTAATTTSDPSQRTQFRHGAANALLDLASEFTKVGLTSEARRELHTAKDLVEAGTPLQVQIDQMLNQVGD